MAIPPKIPVGPALSIPDNLPNPCRENRSAVACHHCWPDRAPGRHSGNTQMVEASHGASAGSSAFHIGGHIDPCVA